MRLQKAEVIHKIGKLRRKINTLLIRMTPNLPTKGVRTSERINKLVTKKVLTRGFAEGLSKFLATKTAHNLSVKSSNRILVDAQTYHDLLKATSVLPPRGYK